MRTHACARALVCAVLCLAGTTACGGESSSSQPDTPSSSTTATASTDEPSPPSEGPTSPSTSTGGSATPSATAPPTGLKGRLLTATELPGFNDAYRWTAGSTGPENPSASFGTCQRFATTSIGAERALVRRFRPAVQDPSAAHDRAGELVAQFPDEQTARRAFEVLKSWRASCAERLRSRTRPSVGPLQTVPVEGGSGGWYLLTYGPVKGDPNAQFFDAQGMALVGSRIAMVSMVLAGQDYDYEQGQEPAALAVRRAAGKLR
jgi:hypothetical protein